MSNRCRRFHPAVLGLLACVTALAAADQTRFEDAPAAAAFKAIIPVLRHPRCMNCHSGGDFPRQGDDGRPHTMQVRRGPHGDGVNAVKCRSCHSEQNTSGLRTPPGAPDWKLPAPETPMIWQGLTDRQICELLKDPSRNGHKSLQQIVAHMSTPLVLWGWHPGRGIEHLFHWRNESFWRM
jgi:hypothetical protein